MEAKIKTETERLIKQLVISIWENEEQASQKISLYISLRSIHPFLLLLNLLCINSTLYFLFTESVL